MERRGETLNWEEIAELCRALLDPDEARSIERQAWREAVLQFSARAAAPEELARAGVTAVLRLPVRSAR